MPTIFDSRHEDFKKPFGALKAGQALSLTLRVPFGYCCISPILLLQKDGETPQQYPLANAGKGDGVNIFTIELELPQVGLYFYWFDLWVDYKKLYMGESGKAVVQTNEGAKWPLTVYDSNFQTPETVHGGVMYQIFPDRFLEGNPEKPMVFSERIYRADKQNVPYFWGEERSYGSLTQDYYGGDLVGIMRRLPFLASLGVTWIYLNPIFEAHSNHRYNTADYMKIDPYLGTNDDFEQLCKQAKMFGINILLDGVFSHTGSDSIYFNKDGRYPSVGAWQGPQSHYRSWYHFHHDGTYDSWWGFDTLPACDKHNADFRNFICGEGGVIDYWLGMGAAGFRLDVADELPDDFIEEIRRAVKRNGEEKLLIGEVWEDASLKEAYGVRRRYFLGEELDGVMNYPFRNAIINFLQSFDAPRFKNEVMAICENYPSPVLCATTNHLSTHDTERIITALVGEPVRGHDRNWQSGRQLSPEQYHLGIVCMRLAFVLQFMLPGVPCIYYGDEIAMQGYADPFNRAYYNWNSGETQLIQLVMKLSALRKDCPVFKDSTIRFITAKNKVLHFERQSGDAKVSIAVNCGTWPVAASMLGRVVTLPRMSFAILSTGYGEDTQAVRSLFSEEQSG